MEFFFSISALGIHIINIPELFDLLPSNLASRGPKLRVLSTVAWQSGLSFLHKKQVVEIPMMYI